MAKITRIKASDGPREEAATSGTESDVKNKISAADNKDKKQAAQKTRAKEKAEEKKLREKEQPSKKVFILFRPFVALGRYLRDAWKEIRQVHWPSRKATWKMVLAVLVYTGIFMLFITLLDLLFRWVFGMILGNGN